MQTKNYQRVMRGAWILSVGALITKILSAVYRVPFQNLVGDTGFYIYQQVYPLYGIGMTLALSGLPVYISQIVAAADTAVEKREAARRTMRLLSVVGVALFLVVTLGAPLLARFMADPALTPLIRIVGVMFLMMPLLATTRGYYQGVGDMVPTAQSQVVEQIIRVIIIIAAAVCGRHFHWSLYLTGAVAMLGSLVGGACAAMLLARRTRTMLAGQWRPAAQTAAARSRFVVTFATAGGALVLFSALLVLFQLIDSFTVVRGLTDAGVAPAAARALKGIYDRGQPLVQLGLVVATALAQGLLPTLTRAAKHGRDVAFNKAAVSMLHLAIASAAVATAGLIVIMPDVNTLLFGDADGSATLMVYVLSIVIVAAINAFASLLQSRNEFRVTTIALVAGVLAKIILNIPLTMIWGTFGSALATCLGLLLMLVVVYAAVTPAIRRGFWHNGYAGRMLVVLGAMASTGALVRCSFTAQGRVAALGHSVILMVCCGTITLVTAWGVRLLTAREMLAIPSGHHILQLSTKLTTLIGRNQKR